MEQIILEALFMVLSIGLSGFWFVLNAVVKMKKLKRFITRLKRHARNKKLSKFCDNFYIANRLSPVVAMSNVFVHPLVYEVLRFRYYRDIIIQCIFPSDFITDYTEVLVCGR